MACALYEDAIEMGAPAGKSGGGVSLESSSYHSQGMALCEIIGTSYMHGRTRLNDPGTWSSS